MKCAILLCVTLAVGLVNSYRPGTPGRDYPNYTQPPRTSFKCRGVSDGYWVDPETGCQGYHVCEYGRKHSFICPIGTLFNQDMVACDHWYNVECQTNQIDSDEVDRQAEAANIHEHVISQYDPQPRPQLVAAKPQRERTTTTTTTTTARPTAGVVYDSPSASEWQYPEYQEMDIDRRSRGKPQTTSKPANSWTFYNQPETRKSSSSNSATDSRGQQPIPQAQVSEIQTADRVDEADGAPEQNEVQKSNDSTPMKMLEDFVSWMAGSDSRSKATQVAENSSDTETAAPLVQPDVYAKEQSHGMISDPRPDGQNRPSYRPTYFNPDDTTPQKYVPQVRKEVWSLGPEQPEPSSSATAQGQAVSEPRPVYRPPYDTPYGQESSQGANVVNTDGAPTQEEGSLVGPDQEEQEMIKLYRQFRNQQIQGNHQASQPLDKKPEESGDHPNPWMFSEASPEKPDTSSSQRSARLTNEQRPSSTGSAFDFEMGQKPGEETRTIGARTQRQPQYSPEKDYARVENAPVGRLDRYGVCRCPASGGPQFY